MSERRLPLDPIFLGVQTRTPQEIGDRQPNKRPQRVRVGPGHGPGARAHLGDAARAADVPFKGGRFVVVADDHGDPEELLAKLDESEKETAKLRDQLKAILEEALLR